LLAPLRQLCHVNLIPVNRTAAAYLVPSSEAIRAFRDLLRAGGVSNSVRAERGDDIAAACGQLAGEVQDRTRVGERSVRAVPVRIERGVAKPASTARMRSAP
jgi:23S rRNA (adenine2503-C2)-methyltransferase